MVIVSSCCFPEGRISLFHMVLSKSDLSVVFREAYIFNVRSVPFPNRKPSALTGDLSLNLSGWVSSSSQEH